MRAFRPSDLVVPTLWGGFAALLAGLAVGRGTGRLGAGVLAAAAVWILAVALAARRGLRRARVVRQPFPEAARRWLDDHVSVYRALPEAERRRFERDVALVLDGLIYDAAGGVEVTDTLKLSVAAGAAVLLHGHPDWELPTERSVLFVPDTFDAAYGDEEDGLYDGMVHSQGPIVLSVRAVEEGWARDDGHNVVLHELAHVFDFEGWEADGVPAFLDPRSADAWVALMRKEMRRAQRGDGILRAYAGSAPAELFAVATEQFFERPARLRSRHEELYDALVAFYNQTPPDEVVPEAGRSLMSRRWG
ncbi:MAG: M90 family metallopeptidase [Bacteroidota bacterium]